MKRWWLVLLVLLLLVIGAIGYLGYTLYQPESGSPYQAISKKAPIVLILNDPAQTLADLRSLNYSEALLKANFINDFSTQLTLLDSTLLKIMPKGWNMEKEQIVAAIHAVAANKADFIYAMHLGTLNQDKFASAITALNSLDIVTNERTYKGVKVFEITLREEEQTFAVTLMEGVVMASFTPTLVDEALMRWESGEHVLQVPDFKKAQELISGTPNISLFLNHAAVGSIEPLLVNPKKTQLISIISQFATWSQVDLMFEQGGIIFNGYTLPKTEGGLLAHISNNKEGVEAAASLPDNVAAFVSLNLKEPAAYLAEKGKDEELANYFSRWMGSDLCFAVQQTFDKKYRPRSYVMVGSNDSTMAAQSLAELVKLRAGNENVGVQGQHIIGQLKLKKPLSELFGEEFLVISSPFYCVLYDKVIFANSENTLKEVLRKLDAGRVLSESLSFQDFSKNLVEGSGMSVYLNPSKVAEAMVGLASDPLATMAEEGDRSFVKMSPLSIQFQDYSDAYFVNGYINNTDEAAPPPPSTGNQLWQVKLNAPAATKPTYVSNHINDDLEIVLQDEQNYVYLIDKTGRIIWDRQISGRINSEIFEIDYYKNGKIQYMFSTEDEIHLIARNAKDVADYPRKLPAKAASGMKLVNYDNARNYRIFIACQNDKIYGYMHNFQPLPGWNPKPNAGNIEFPFMHFMVNRKDYLVAFNDRGTTFYFDRRGEKRVGVIFTKTHFDHPFYLENKGTDFSLVSIDTSGVLHRLDSKGIVDKKETYGDIPFYDFIYTDADGNNTYEYVFLDSTVLTVTDLELKPLYTYNFNQPVNGEVFKVGGKYLGVVDKEHGLVYLFDDAGSLVSGFPLEGTTAFEVAPLHKAGESVIVVSDQQGNLSAIEL